MFTRKCRQAVLAILFIGIQLIQSAQADSIIELGIHFGGDELVYEPYENGKKDTIKAGEMWAFDFGRLYQFSPSWEVQLTFGVKSDAKYDNNTEVTWVRYPLNGQLFYRMNKVRFGLGVTRHFEPKLEGAGYAANINETYQDATGGLLELDFVYSHKFLWGVRLTSIEYRSKKDGHVVDGSSIGFLIIAQL